MSKIAGKDVLLFIAISASPEVLQGIGCSRTCTLTTNTVTAGVSTLGSGIYSEFKALSINWTVSVDGLATFGENMDMATLREYQFALQPVVIVFTDSTAAQYRGYGIITSAVNTGNYNDVETYSVQIQGTGELTF
jgi:predicted secreted protein